MGNTYLGEIKMLGFHFAPRNFAFCDGGKLPKEQYKALTFLLGGTFGQDPNYFKLPDLRGRIMVGDDHVKYKIGHKGGAENVSLKDEHVPEHTHTMMATTDKATKPLALNHYLAATSFNLYRKAQNLVALGVVAVSESIGDDAPHENRQPSLGINFCICLNGTLPFQYIL